MKSTAQNSNSRNHNATQKPGDQRRGHLFTASEGENLVHFRDGGRISIKASSATGSEKLTLATQQVVKGSAIPIHRHLQMDEALYILEGKGLVWLDDVQQPFDKGTTVFIPANMWHSFENPDNELLLFWIAVPAGLDGFFSCHL